MVRLQTWFLRALSPSPAHAPVLRHLVVFPLPVAVRVSLEARRVKEPVVLLLPMVLVLRLKVLLALWPLVRLLTVLLAPRKEWLLRFVREPLRKPGRPMKVVKRLLTWLRLLFLLLRLARWLREKLM